MIQATRTKRNKGLPYWAVSILLLMVFSALPAMGILKFSEEWGKPVVLGYMAIISVVTLFLYQSDKRKAQSDLRRTPESSLHLIELAGGWAAAFISQRIFVHKISKLSYQCKFWIIGLVHNYLAFDYLNNWHTTVMLIHAFKP